MSSVLLYISSFVLSALMLYNGSKNKKISLSFVIGCLIPILLAALRYYVGTDYESYVYMYQNNSNLSFYEWRNFNGDADSDMIGVWLIAKIAGVFGSKEVFFAVFAFLSVVPVAWRLKEDYDEATAGLSYFIYLTTLYIISLNMCKQAAAIGILFFGFKYVRERKLIKYLLIVLCAMAIHITAFAAVFIYFVYDENGKLWSAKRFFCLVGAIAALVLLPNILTAIGGHFESYLVYKDETNNKSFFILLFWCAAFLLLHGYYVRERVSNSTLIFLMIIGAVLSLTGFNSPYIKRIAMYFTLPQFVLMGQIPNFFHTKESRLLVQYGILLYSVAIFIISYYVLGQADVIPYRFVGGV